MKFVALVLAAILTVSCASSGRYDAKEEEALASWRPGTFPVRIDNNVFEHVTVYVTNGGTQRRIGNCPGVSRCWLWVNKTATERIFSEGAISLGWRWFGGPPGLHGEGTIAAWEGLTVILTLNRANWYMHSEFFGNKEAE